MLENPNFDTEDIEEQGNEMGDGPQGGQDQGQDPNQGGSAGGDGANQNWSIFVTLTRVNFLCNDLFLKVFNI